MTTTHIVTEGRSDAGLILEVLRHEGARGVELFHPGGWQRAESLARSLLVVREGPVALVIDADGALEERRGFLEESLWEVEPDRSRWRVFFFEPDLETHVERALGCKWRGDDSSQSSLSAADLERLGGSSPMVELIAFIKSARDQAA